ncbi:MAG: hypothetical protein QQW96_04045 [Tychonema bourrellyi B0820]|nr:hypothetical protein [Tychonema bourrellyi B0820]
MTQNQWCKTNYHSDGKRRFGKLINGLCSECHERALEKSASLREQTKKEIEALIKQRASINTRINKLRRKYELQKP